MISHLFFKKSKKSKSKSKLADERPCMDNSEEVKSEIIENRTIFEKSESECEKHENRTSVEAIRALMNDETDEEEEDSDKEEAEAEAQNKSNKNATLTIIPHADRKRKIESKSDEEDTPTECNIIQEQKYDVQKKVAYTKEELEILRTRDEFPPDDSYKNLYPKTSIKHLMFNTIDGSYYTSIDYKLYKLFQEAGCGIIFNNLLATQSYMRDINNCSFSALSGVSNSTEACEINPWVPIQYEISHKNYRFSICSIRDLLIANSKCRILSRRFHIKNLPWKKIHLLFDLDMKGEAAVSLKGQEEKIGEHFMSELKQFMDFKGKKYPSTCFDKENYMFASASRIVKIDDPKYKIIEGAKPNIIEVTKFSMHGHFYQLVFNNSWELKSFMHSFDDYLKARPDTQLLYDLIDLGVYNDWSGIRMFNSFSCPKYVAYDWNTELVPMNVNDKAYDKGYFADTLIKCIPNMWYDKNVEPIDWNNKDSVQLQHNFNSYSSSSTSHGSEEILRSTLEAYMDKYPDVFKLKQGKEPTMYNLDRKKRDSYCDVCSRTHKSIGQYAIITARNQVNLYCHHPNAPKNGSNKRVAIILRTADKPVKKRKFTKTVICPSFPSDSKSDDEIFDYDEVYEEEVDVPWDQIIKNDEKWHKKNAQLIKQVFTSSDDDKSEELLEQFNKLLGEKEQAIVYELNKYFCVLVGCLKSEIVQTTIAAYSNSMDNADDVYFGRHSVIKTLGFIETMKNKKILHWNTKSGKFVEEGLLDVWFSSGLRRDCSIDIFNPNVENFKKLNEKKKTKQYNVWSGMAINQKAAKIYCDNLKKNNPGKYEEWVKRWELHLLDNMCSGAVREYEFLKKWISHIFQKPGKRTNVMIVLDNKAKGSGAGALFKILRRIIGKHTYHTQGYDALKDNFNVQLVRNILVFADETLTGNDMAADSVIKPKITDDTIETNEKFRTKREESNYLNFISASNMAGSITITDNDRRYQPIKVSSKNAGIPNDAIEKYWSNIFEIPPEVIAHYHYFDVNIDGWNPSKEIVVNEEMQNIAEITRDPVHNFVLQALRQGNFVSKYSIYARDYTEILTPEKMDGYRPYNKHEWGKYYKDSIHTSFLRSDLSSDHKTYYSNKTTFWLEFWKCFPENTTEKNYKEKKYKDINIGNGEVKRPLYICLATLDQCREFFAKKLGNIKLFENVQDEYELNEYELKELNELKLEGKCSCDDTHEATLSCNECVDIYCEACFAIHHQHEKRKNHKSLKFVQLSVNKEEEKKIKEAHKCICNSSHEATWFCLACNGDYYCDNCVISQHKSRKTINHQYIKINKE